MDIEALKKLSNCQAAMAAMMDGVRICIFDAWHWDDERLHAAIHSLMLSGVPIDWVDAKAQSPITGTVSIKRYYFINFGLLDDEEAQKARDIERTLRQLKRASSLADMINHYIHKLKMLGFEPTEEQLNLF